MAVDIRSLAELDDAASRLREAAVKVIDRGNGQSRFVYAERNGYAIELSKSAEGWWVEFWANERVAAEHTYAFCIDAVSASKSWLAQNAA